MKEGWEIKKLGEVCEILNGYAFKSELYTNEGVRILRITNVQKGVVVDEDPKFYPMDKMSNLQQYILRDNDLLMSLTGNVGRVGLLQKSMLPAALNQRVACLRINSNNLSNKYLFHVLNSDKFESDAIFSASGIAQKNMSTEWLKKYSIPIPPLPEQERIVSELDCINGILEKKREQIKELDALAQSVFYHMFGDPVTNEKGWEVKKLGKVAEILGGYAFKSDLFKDEGIPVLRIGNINTGVLRTSSIVYYKEEPSLEKYTVYPRDLVMSLTGTVGKDDYGNVCVLDNTYPKYYLNQRNAKFTLSEQIQVDYLKYFLQDKCIKSQIVSVNRGVRQGNIANRDIEKLTLPLPPLSLQQSFATKIAAIEKQKELIKRSIAEVETLLASRMQHYFG